MVLNQKGLLADSLQKHKSYHQKVKFYSETDEGEFKEK